MSDMKTWAEREISLAKLKEREGPKGKKEECDYGFACYDSAYKAYKSLLSDGHSGMSICITKDILNRLIDGKPLTPIEDTVEVWSEINYEDTIKRSRQCLRMSSLFKDEYKDGRIAYHDTRRQVGVDADGFTYSGYIPSVIVDKLFPITMPYYPHNNPYKVFTESFVYDTGGKDPSELEGCYDTIGASLLVTPTGERYVLDEYYKETEEGDLIKISKEEYLKRKAAWQDRIAAETMEGDKSWQDSYSEQ